MDNTKCTVSVIIPCYNQGHFIQEALDSIIQSEILYPVEIIIVNDGSTDTLTIAKFEELSAKGYHVIHQHNQGLAAARNTGIAHAKGRYILPLDADNKINVAYINKSVPILGQGIYSIVYSQPKFFGETKDSKRKYRAKPFDIYDIVGKNYIDACAVYAKEVWTKNNGYDINLPNNGHEDWEFWIHAYANGFRFHFIPQKLFWYRIIANSMIENFNDKKLYAQDHRYIIAKHNAFFTGQVAKLSYIKRKYDIDIKRFIASPVIFLLYILKLIKQPGQKAAERFKFYDDN